MAICGSSCTLDVSGNLSDAHNFTLNWATNESDVRSFGSGDFGEWLACASNGTLTVNTYDLISGVEPGTADILYEANCGSATFAGNCVATTVNIAVDAKGLVEYTHTFRLTGDIQIS